MLEAFDKPLLAAVNGLGLGIGATILPHCDIVWIAEGARLKVPFVTLGVTTEAAGSLLLPQRMGWQAAVALHLHRRLDERGGGGGVRPRVEGVPAESLLDEVMDVARQIGAMPVDSLQTTKRLMVAARADAVRAAREREDAEFVRMVGSQANQEALAQFLS